MYVWILMYCILRLNDENSQLRLCVYELCGKTTPLFSSSLLFPCS